MTRNISKRRLLSLLLIFVILAGTLPFNAAEAFAATKITLEDTSYDRPDPSKFYTKYYYKDDSGNWTWKWSKAVTEGKMHKYVLNRTSDTAQKWAYCIEPDKIMAESYDITDTDSDDYWNALNSSQRMGISLVLKFGLQHNKFAAYGYTNKESTAAYIATQCLVWEFKEGVRTTSDFSRNTVTNSAGETRVPAATYYNVVKQNDTCLEIYTAIINAVKKYYNGASFTRKSSADAKEAPITLKWDPKTEQYSATVTDSNNCGLYGSDIADALGENYKVTRSGNKYTITKLTTAAATKTIKIESYGSDMLEGRSGETQKVWTNTLKQPLMTGSSHPVNLYATFDTEDTGYLKVIKTVSGQPSDEKINYSDFTFVIKDSSGKEVYRGNPSSSGSFKVRLATGTYTVSEVLTTAQKKIYKVLSEQTAKVTTSHTSTAPLEKTFANKWKTGSIEIVKTSTDGNLVGHKFKITGPGGYSKTVTTTASDLNTAKTEARLVVGNLPAGTYTVEELASAKYEAQDPVKVNLTGTEDPLKATVTFKNIAKPLEMKIRAVKYDSELNKIVTKSGFQFKIYDNSAKAYLKNTATGTDVFTTGSSGYTDYVTVKKEGTFTVSEVGVPAGSNYLCNAAAQTVTATESALLAGQSVSVKMSDTPQKVKLTIEKSGQAFKTVTTANGMSTPVFESTGLSGAKYTITAADTIKNGIGETVYAKGTQVAILTTDSNGTATSGNLYPGKYHVTETTAPAGYIISNTAGEDVTLTPTNGTTAVTTVKKSYVDDIIKAKLVINKVMADDSVFGLGNNGEIKKVVFGLYAGETLTAKDGKTIAADTLIDKLTMTSEGANNFTKTLPKGKYYVKEIATDGNYVLDSTKYSITFSPSGNSATYTVNANGGNKITNMIKYGQIKIIKTDKETGKPVNGAKYGIWKVGTATLTADNALKIATTQSGEAVFDNLIMGEYYVKELVAPEGYVLNPIVYRKKVSTTGEIVEVKTTDHDAFGDLTIMKYDSDGKSPLDGVKFALLDKNGTTRTATTGTDGKVTFKNVPVGEYTLSETKTKPGHQLLKDSIKITIPVVMKNTEVSAEHHIYLSDEFTSNDEGTTSFFDQSLEIKNSSEFKMPSTGGHGFMPYVMGGMFVLMLVCALAILTKEE